MGKCFVCGHEVMWQSDFNYDEVHSEGEGVVSYYTCSNPDCNAEYEVSIREDGEED